MINTTSSEQATDSKLLKWSRQINRTYIIVCSVVCRIHPLGSYSNFEHKYFDQRTCKLICAGRRISKAIFCLAILCLLHMCCSLYFQYSYDFLLVRLEHQDRLGLIDAARGEIVSKILSEKWRQLELIGSPYRVITFGVEVIYLLCMVMSLYIYFLGYIYYNFMRRFDLYIPRREIEPTIDLDRVDEITQSLIKDYAMSCETFYSMRLSGADFDETSHPYIKVVPSKVGNTCESDLSQINRKISLKRYQVTFEQACQNYTQIQRLFRSGRLRCLNKVAIQVDSFSYEMSKNFISFTLYGLFFAGLMSYWLRKLYDPDIYKQDAPASRIAREPYRLSWSDLFVYADLFILLTLVFIAGIYHGTLRLTCCSDQIILVSKLSQLLKSSIIVNQKLFHGVKNGNPGNRNQYNEAYNKMNLNLIYCLIQFKLFLAQTKIGVRDYLRLFIPPIVVMIIFPLITKLHIPYLASHQDQDVRLITTTMCILIVGPVMVSLVPMCRIYSRCLDLYRALASLLAHVIAINYCGGFGSMPQEMIDQSKVPVIITEPILKRSTSRRDPRSINENYHLIYEPCLERMLRKVMAFPDRLLNGFATKSLGIACTYSFLIKVAFWVGIFNLSLNSDYEGNNNRDLINSILSDPWGAFVD